jgi:cyclophilin family peptidyl-prolyl cis-trans isomerase
MVKKKGMKNCPHCGCEVSAQKYQRHLRKAHPEKMRKAVKGPKKKEKRISKRRQEALEQVRREKKKKGAFAVFVVVIIILAAIAVYVYWPYLFPEDECKHEELDSGNKMACIKTNKGIIIFELYQQRAPDTTKNYIKLAKGGHYRNTIFHRVIDDFMIQGGGFDRDRNQKTSPYGSINLEIHPELTHVDGAVAMARTTDPNSASNQFYICDGPQHSLDDEEARKRGDRGYAVFGQVIEGMEVVRDISDDPTENLGDPFADIPRQEIYIKDVKIIG